MGMWPVPNAPPDVRFRAQSGPRRALRPFFVCRMELEPYHEAHHHNRCNQNDNKGTGVESHGVTFFNARTMRSFKLFA